DRSRGPPIGSSESGGASILMTLAPQSASWRAQVGPARTRVKSSTVKRASALDARGKGTAQSPFIFSAKLPKDPELGRSFGCCPPAPAPTRHHRATRLTKTPAHSHLSDASADDHPGGLPDRGPIDKETLTMMTFRSSLAVFLIAVFSVAALAEERGGKPAERPAHSEQGGQSGPGVLSLLPPDSVPAH